MKNRIIILFLLFTLSSIFQFPAFGQEENTAECWHEELDELSFLTGTWVLDSNFRLGNGIWERDTSKSIIKPDFYNCMFSEVIIGKRGDHVFEARSHFTYNANTKKFQKLWIDSEHGWMVLYEGNKEEGLVVFMTEITVRDQVVKFRHRYSLEDPDSFSMFSERSMDGGKNWITTWEIHYKRQH